MALRLGQLSFLLLALFTLAWQAAHDGRSLRLGVLLGVLCLVKPFYGLLFVWLVWRRDWRSVGAFIATYVLGTGIGLIVVGPAGYLQWLSRLREISWQGHLFNASVFGIGARLFEHQTVARAAAWTPLTVSPSWHRVATLLGITIVALVTWRALRGASRDPDRVFAALGLCGPLLSPLGWIHYLPICIGPVLAVLTRYRSKWYWVLGILGVCPYAFMVNHRYGQFGTLLVGQWAFLTMFGVLAILANRRFASGDELAVAQVHGEGKT
jgi:alpha-1,2-mannosyltransferase